MRVCSGAACETGNCFISRYLRMQVPGMDVDGVFGILLALPHQQPPSPSPEQKTGPIHGQHPPASSYYIVQATLIQSTSYTGYYSCTTLHTEPNKLAGPISMFYSIQISVEFDIRAQQSVLVRCIIFFFVGPFAWRAPTGKLCRYYRPRYFKENVNLGWEWNQLGKMKYRLGDRMMELFRS